MEVLFTGNTRLFKFKAKWQKQSEYKNGKNDTDCKSFSPNIFKGKNLSRMMIFCYYVSLQILLRKQIASKFRLWQKMRFGLEWRRISSTYDLSLVMCQPWTICLFLFKLLLASLEALMGHSFKGIRLQEKVARKPSHPLPSPQLS